MNKTNLSTIDTNPLNRCKAGMKNLFKYSQTWAMIILIFSTLSTLNQLFTDNNPDSASRSNKVEFGDISVFALLGFTASLTLLVLFISAYVNGIAAFITWKTTRNESAGFIEAFKAVSQRFWTILAVQVFSAVRIIGGLLLFVVPGVRALLRYQMALLPVFDENLNAKNAMNRIKGLTSGHLLEVLGIIGAGLLPFVGGVLQIGGQSVLYPQLKKLEKYNGPQPKVHWLNYTLFILAAILVAILADGISVTS